MLYGRARAGFILVIHSQSRKLKRFAVAASAGAAAFALAGCGHDVALDPLNQFVLSTQSKDGIDFNFCLDPSYVPKQVLKTVIVLDHSGSNKANYVMSPDGSPTIGAGGAVTILPSLGTDPTGTLRYGSDATPGTLLNYLNTLPANDPLDPTKYFALVDFSNGVSAYPADAKSFTADIGAFHAAIKADVTPSPQDGGATSYLAALTTVSTIINKDIEKEKACAALPATTAPSANCPRPGAPTASTYAVIFMSDGAPILEIDGAGTNNVTVKRESAVDILAQVEAISALTTQVDYVNSVNFFSIYYYHAGNLDPQGKALLANMATAGNGVSYVALSGTNIDYAQFQPAAKRVKFTLGDVFVTNASTTYWSDGRLHPDTDRDGLPDDVEASFGTDPLRAATSGGLNDLVRYRLSPSIDFSKCASYPMAQASDPDGLSDCEKALLSDVPGIKSPDSNGDLIPDFLEFKNGVAFQAGSLPAVNDPSQDGWSAYQKIKYSLPVGVNVNQFLGLRPASYKLNLVSSTDSQDCYALRVENMPIQPLANATPNVIRFDVIEKAEMLRSKYRYYVGQKAFPVGSQSLSAGDWNDAVEKAAGTWQAWK